MSTPMSNDVGELVEPVAWQCRVFIAGMWTSWRDCDPVLVKTELAFNLTNGTVELRALVPATVLSSRAAEIAELRVALQLTSGALQLYKSRYPTTTPIRFTGKWAHLGGLAVEAILDQADAALGKEG